MLDYFAEEVKRYDWHKPRALPDWAQRIFSSNMIAAGNVSDEAGTNSEESPLFLWGARIQRGDVDDYVARTPELSHLIGNVPLGGSLRLGGGLR